MMPGVMMLADMPECLVQRIFSFCPSKLLMISGVCRTFVQLIAPALNECLSDTSRNAIDVARMDDAFQLISQLACRERYTPLLKNSAILRTLCESWIRQRAIFGRRTWMCGVAACIFSSFKHSENAEDILNTLGKDDVISIGTTVC